MAVHAYLTMTEAVKELQDRGFIGNFEVIDSLIRDFNSERTFRADELTIVEHHRFEGISDPDDSSVAYALKAKDGSTQGSWWMPTGRTQTRR
jgi:hypothetical protein